MTAEELALLGRTAVHLQPSQVAHRARLRVQRAALRRWPELGQRLLASARPVSAGGWPTSFTPLDATAPQRWPGLAQLASGRITLLGVIRDLGEPAQWQHADAPQLWRYHLHYWDWAWGLAAEADRGAARAMFARLWQSWQAACGFGHGDAWLPYPTALRAWSWCGLYRDLVAGSDLEPDFLREVTAHAGFLRRHLESDVGGNHLIKGLKALAGLGLFLRDERLLARALERLTAQLAVQVLPDGGHYERAPAYHCQVLADLIDVSEPAQRRRAGARSAADAGDRPDAPLARRGAGPRWRGAAAQRRIPGPPRGGRRAAAGDGTGNAPGDPSRHRADPGRGRRLAPDRRRRRALPG